MSKKIEEGIKNILENGSVPEEKINELLDLSFSSADIKNIENALIQIYADEYGVELTKTDINSEISSIAYRNEGMMSIPDEKAVAGISKERKELLVSLKEKLKNLQETKKIDEPKNEEEETVIDATGKIDDDLSSVFADEPEEKIAPQLERNYFEPNSFGQTRAAKNSGSYLFDTSDFSFGTSAPSAEDTIDRQIIELNKEAEELSAKVNKIKEKNARLMHFKQQRDTLIKQRDKEIRSLEEEMARRKNHILTMYDQEINALYAQASVAGSYSNPDTSSLDFRLK